jgi:hypothetical protein
MLSTNTCALPTGNRAFLTSRGTMGPATRGKEMRMLEWAEVEAGKQPPPGVNVIWKDTVTGNFEMQHGMARVPSIIRTVVVVSIVTVITR